MVPSKNWKHNKSAFANCAVCVSAEKADAARRSESHVAAPVIRVGESAEDVDVHPRALGSVERTIAVQLAASEAARDSDIRQIFVAAREHVHRDLRAGKLEPNRAVDAAAAVFGKRELSTLVGIDRGGFENAGADTGNVSETGNDDAAS